MFSLWLECDDAGKDLLTTILWEAGTAGITEHEFPGGRWELEAFFDKELDLSPFAPYHPRWKRVASTDWLEVSRAMWEPLPVGERFYLVPEWREDAAPAGRVRLTVHPGLACGTGYHAATQLALRAMERHLVAGSSFLDVGTGSGILSEAALLLGAGRVTACDIDYEAARIARCNLGPRATVSLFCGSVRSVTTGAFETVAANLNAQSLLGLMADLERVCRGTLILSGFTQRDVKAVQAAIHSAPASDLLEQDEWRCIVLRFVQ
ncbi:MAG: 50S ribosomal protein L11 methyltransferase [Bryobacteraceae bacterium]|nr:50S ribosomal protein L11 methyltransferase [Bryobacterales bacterium]MEB2362560.1 50S ribosomal protein L11 methyltransferase [Bryobacterales bacterium]NUN01658.1 50S ribosomal protein L11 methyltransferase [Bryobacteraceae bacterium]